MRYTVIRFNFLIIIRQSLAYFKQIPLRNAHRSTYEAIYKKYPKFCLYYTFFFPLRARIGIKWNYWYLSRNFRNSKTVYYNRVFNLIKTSFTLKSYLVTHENNRSRVGLPKPYPQLYPTLLRSFNQLFWKKLNDPAYYLKVTNWVFYRV